MGEEAAVVLEPPRPKSPPRYPDLCGRRRLQLELQILNREVDFLKVSVPAAAVFPLLRPHKPHSGRGPRATPSVSHLTWPPLKNLKNRLRQDPIRPAISFFFFSKRVPARRTSKPHPKFQNFTTFPITSNLSMHT